MEGEIEGELDGCEFGVAGDGVIGEREDAGGGLGEEVFGFVEGGADVVVGVDDVEGDGVGGGEGFVEVDVGVAGEDDGGGAVPA